MWSSCASKKRLKPNFNSEGMIFVPFFDDLSLRLESEIDGHIQVVT